MLKEGAVTAVTAPFCMPGSACPAIPRESLRNQSVGPLTGFSLEVIP